MWDSKSGRSFLQKCRFIMTGSRPRPMISPGALLAHSLPLQPPLPEPEAIPYPDGNPPPDRVSTPAWPH